MSKLVALVREASESIDNGRTPFSVLSACTAELGELAEEVAILEGYSYKRHGPDGVLGESIDLLASVLDLIFVVEPDITEEELEVIMTDKLEKWKRKTKMHGHFGKTKS